MTDVFKSKLLAIGFAALAASAANGMTVVLTTSVSPPAPVGTVVTFSAAVPDASPNLWYRFRVRRPGEEYQMIRDYGAASALPWTAAAHEGFYEMEVSARDSD